MPVYFDQARQRWRYEFSRVVGGRRRRATKLLPKPWTRAKAEAYARAQDEHLYAVATGAVRQQPLIAEAVALYLAERAPALKNRALLERDLALVMPWYEGMRMDQLAEVARSYAAENKALAPATIKLRLAYLRAACRWGWKKHKLGNHDPAERMTLPSVSNERHVYVERADLLFLCRSITDLDCRAVVLVAFYSGMRLSECIRAEPTNRGWLLTDTKNGERRLIPIHPKVAHLARRWPLDIKPREVQRWWKWSVTANGYGDIRFHDLRHSAASAMINQGVPLYTVGAVLGHKAAASTKRYSHLDTSTLVEAVGRIGKRR
jgi:integrase